MSVDLSYFIEFKDKKESKWQLLSCLIPKHSFDDEDEKKSGLCAI